MWQGRVLYPGKHSKPKVIKKTLADLDLYQFVTNIGITRDMS